MPIRRSLSRAALRSGVAAAACATGALLASAQDAAPSVFLCEWPAVPGADYYDGKMNGSADPIRFRTAGTWVIVPRDCDSMTLTPHAASGAPLAAAGTVRARRSAMQAPPVTTPPAEVAAPTDDAPPPPPPPPLVDEPIDLEPEEYEKEDGGMVAETGAPSDSEGSAKSSKHVAATLWLGLGKEWVTGESGITEFKGSAHIGGTGLDARWLGRAPSLYGVAHVAAHRFRIAVEEVETDAAEDVSEREAKVLRVTTRVGLLRAFSPAKPAQAAPLLGLGGGVGYNRLPVLALADDEAGTARLDAASVFGPWLGGVAEWGFGDADVVGLGATAGWSSGWEKARATVFTGEAHWRHDLTESLAADGAAAYERAEIKAPVDCGDRESCTSEGTTASTTTQLRLGIGWRW
jgi:hypothetical protein